MSSANQSIVRRLARGISRAVQRYPGLSRLLRDGFLKLPPELRGPQMIHDHLVKLSRELEAPTFCIVGANDGITNDHVYPFARKGRWRGLAIEPVPGCFSELEKVYRNLPVKLFNVAIHETDSFATLHFLDPAKASLPPWAKGVGSFDPERLEIVDELPGTAGAITELRVPCRRLDDLIDETGFERIDLVVIDTEGYDAAVLRQVRFDDWGVRTVIFEHTLLSAADLDSSKSLLERNGFTIQKDEFDVLATRPKVAV